MRIYVIKNTMQLCRSLAVGLFFAWMSIQRTHAACVSGAIAADTTWYLTNSPIQVCGNITINAGVTLTIEAGTTVQLGGGVIVLVASSGRILAEGTAAAPISFIRTPTNGAPAWAGISINGGPGAPETRLVYAYFEGNSRTNIMVVGGTLYLDHATFGTTTRQYVSLDGASFMVTDCYFPTPTAAFEPCHGTGGIRSDGRGIFRRNFWGKPNNYNDVVDFTGGNRPSQPIVQFLNNVVSGGDDDGFDIDGTDAWIEGNIFLHMHKNGGTPDSASGVSGGNDSGNTSEITIIGNISYDCDQLTAAKQGNFFTLFNNTVVHQTHVGGIDSTGAVVLLADAGTVQAAGMYLEGNILYDIEQLSRNATTASVSFTNNLLPLAFGPTNTFATPIFKHLPLLSETFFTNWAQAQVMWDWLSLMPGSPGIGAGPNGRDMGAVVPHGISISGEPVGTTTSSNASLKLAINRTGSGIPTAGWPNGSGYVAYKWRLDTNLAWSSEIPITTPLNITHLSSGAHHVEVIGKTDAGVYQDDASVFGTNGVRTVSRTWNVQGPFSLSSPALTGNQFTMHFPAAAGNTYSVQCIDAFDPGYVWINLTNVPAQPSSGDAVVTDPSAFGPKRFYRVVTP